MDESLRLRRSSRRLRRSSEATAENRRLLEALVFWRGLYAHRGPLDSAPVESLATTMARAVTVMRQPSV